MLSADIKKFIQKALSIKIEPSLDVPSVKEFGHYSTNVAMRLARLPASGGAKGDQGGEQAGKTNPMELAGQFVVKLTAADKNGMFSKIEAKAPGFINFWLSPKFLHFALLRAKKAGPSKLTLGKGKKVIVEYSSPNIAKPMHVGHLRSTIIGDALANIYEFLGYKVLRWNYVGDWGTQFGKLIAAYKMWGDKKKIEDEPIKTLLELYVHFHEELKTKPELEKQGQEEFRKLEQGDKENRKLWRWFKEESLKEFEKTYKLLGVKFDTSAGESSYEKELQGLVKALLSFKGGLVERSEGSLIVPLGRFNLPPALVQKSDGASLYLTRDIALLKDRLKKYKPEKILYVVANEQALHFEQLFAIAKVLKLDSAELAHVKFGLVLGEDGKKLSTREGKTVALDELLTKIIAIARQVVDEKNPDLSEKERQSIAQAVGVAAVKYNDLKENRQSDIIFDWKRMLDFSGDSAPYLQYTYTRLRSILSKAKTYKSTASSLAKLVSDSELSLIKKVLDFQDVVSLCAETNLTSHLAKYLFELAKLSNHFYEVTPILKDENNDLRTARLVLVNAVASTLRSGLGLLGVKVLKEI